MLALRAPRTWLVGVAAAPFVLGACGQKKDTVAQGRKKDAASGVRAPAVEEIKPIAADGFVSGLPIKADAGDQADNTIQYVLPALPAATPSKLQ